MSYEQPSEEFSSGFKAGILGASFAPVDGFWSPDGDWEHGYNAGVRARIEAEHENEVG